MIPDRETATSSISKPSDKREYKLGWDGMQVSLSETYTGPFGNGSTMHLARIEPEKPGYDLRTFECPKWSAWS